MKFSYWRAAPTAAIRTNRERELKAEGRRDARDPLLVAPARAAARGPREGEESTTLDEARLSIDAGSAG